MKKLFVTLSIGDKYVKEYESLFAPSQRAYAKKFDYDFKIIDEFIYKKIPHNDTISFNKILAFCQEWSEQYDYIAFVDADIFINPDSPDLIDNLSDKTKVGVVDEYSQPTKDFRTEAGNSFVFDLGSHVQGVANGKHPGIIETDHIAGIGIFDNGSVLSEQLLRSGQTERLSSAGVFHRHVFLEATAADAHKRDPVPVTGIHVGLKLEHETTEPFPQGIDQSLAAGTGDRTLSHL